MNMDLFKNSLSNEVKERKVGLKCHADLCNKRESIVFTVRDNKLRPSADSRVLYFRECRDGSQRREGLEAIEQHL